MSTIDSFSGPNRFLSNFYPAPVVLDGSEYPSVENAYQAAKALPRHSDRIPFRRCSAAEAKKMGRRLALRSDWEAVKLGIMLDLLRQKFSEEPLRSKLLATGTAPLIEGNTWGDRFWGVCNGVGENHLGRLLMQVRDELRRADLTAALHNPETAEGAAALLDIMGPPEVAS